MDPLIAAAARALASGDPIGAMKRVALRGDAPALALRGIAMAQFGEYARARTLLRDAARAFGPGEKVARARCIVAEAEIALASRELNRSVRALEAARGTLEKHGDRANAAHARHIQVRRLLLTGHLDEAERALGELDPAPYPSALRAAHELVVAGIAMRRLDTGRARDALIRAERAARRAHVPALKAEVERAARILDTPAARLVTRDGGRLLLLGEIEALLASETLVVNVFRYVVQDARTRVPLASRPVLFALARALGEAWPGDVDRQALVTRAFRARVADATYRARLRVEIGRLRKLLRPVAGVDATDRGFVLVPHRAREVAVLERPIEEKHAVILACLADGESWSSSALALATGASQRTVQRALDALSTAGKVQAMGHGRARRWMTPPIPGFTTALLLSAPLPGG